MNAIKEKVAQNKVALSVVAGTVVLVVILSVLLDKDTVNAPANGDTQAANVIGGLADVTGDFSLKQDTKAQRDVVQTITYPVFAKPDMFDYVGAVNACNDEIVWVRTSIPWPVAVLNATLREMITSTLDLGYEPGNVIARQENLSFDKATIEHGVAKVYLTGSLSSNKKDSCDASRPYIQITEAAKQFPTVTSVSIFLNGVLVK